MGLQEPGETERTIGTIEIGIMKLKHIWILLIFMIGIGMAISVFNWMVDFSPGTLGTTAETDLNCPESDVGYRIDALSEISPYKMEEKDSSAVSWLKEDGYDFLNDHCINIRKRLYLIIVTSDGSAASNESSISIQAYYDRYKRSWVYAKEFTSADEYRAEKAMKYLTNEMSTCL